jgi:hypothetical protein
VEYRIDLCLRRRGLRSRDLCRLSEIHPDGVAGPGKRRARVRAVFCVDSSGSGVVRVQGGMLSDPVALLVAVAAIRVSERVVARWGAGLRTMVRARIRVVVDIALRPAADRRGDRDPAGPVGAPR